jgi:hypothetical protein
MPASRPAPALAPLAALLSLLLLQACSTTLQTYSSPQHETRSLSQASLREGGIAFLTPSTITGQEEDKQTLAYLFAATLRTRRPDVKVLPLSETIGAVNRGGLAEVYRSMYRDYRDTAVFDGSLLRRIAQAGGVRYLAQLKLSQMQQGSRGRLGLLGLSILNTQYASIRLSLQVWDSVDGSIAWEGIDEVTMAIDTGLEQPMPFRAVAERAAEDLVARLP